MINREEPRSKKEARKELKELKSTLAELRSKHVEEELKKKRRLPTYRLKQHETMPKKKGVK